MLSAIQKNVPQTFNFTVSTELASSTAEFGEHGQLVMLSEMHNNVQNILILCQARGCQMTQLSPESMTR